MLDKLLAILRESKVTAWELWDVETRGWEFYFIRHALEQNRAKNVEHLTVKVYQAVEDGAYLGSASCEIAPTATEEEMRAQIEALSYRATLVKNRPYTLHKPVPVEVPALETVDLAAIAEGFLQAVRTLPETEGEDINSYELFVSEKTRRCLNSEGVDLTERCPDSMLEIVVNARREGHEIELYRNYTSGSCDAAALRRDLERTMQFGRDRLRAQPTPALGTADLLLTTRDAVTLFRYFADRLDVAMIYRKMSDWELGKPVADFTGDRPTITALRELPNSSRNRLFDAEGAPICDAVLLENGVARRYLGQRMFAAYLGLEDAFIPTNYAVSGGTHTEDELRAGPYLEVVEFSDFQVDSLTGDIFGEIRLAYWHDGERVTPVTGGSVSGSMLELAGALRFTEATAQYDNCRVPAATLVPGVTVTG